MTSTTDEREGVGTRPGVFATTHWSVVLAAKRGDSAEAATAMESLCGTYWYPLYAHIRRSGNTHEEARDLTQAFFADLLGRDFLKNVASEKGRFRSFLLACLNHFLSDERDRAQAIKRGRDQQTIPLDADLAETRYREEPADELTPEVTYERRWAITLLGRARIRLAGEYAAAGKTDLLHRLEEFPLGERGESSFRDCAVRLGLTESALKSAVHRMRQRYRDLVREEVAHTVDAPCEVEEEIRHLIAVMSR